MSTTRAWWIKYSNHAAPEPLYKIGDWVWWNNPYGPADNRNKGRVEAMEFSPTRGWLYTTFTEFIGLALLYEREITGHLSDSEILLWRLSS